MKNFNQFFNDYMKKAVKKNLPENEVEKGEKVEQEHINPKKVKTKEGKKLARNISKNHVQEDPEYYTKLAKWHKD